MPRRSVGAADQDSSHLVTTLGRLSMRSRGVQPIRVTAWVLGALAGLLAAAPAGAQSKELRFGHLHSAESPVHKGIAKAAEEFAKSTAGRYRVNIFPSSQLGAAREMVAQV